MKSYLLSISVFILTLSCTQEKECLIAQNVSLDNFFGRKETLILKNDSTFTFSFVPNNKSFGKGSIISGKYKLLNDTIYLKIKKLSTKIILAGDQIELLPLNAKIKILKNNLSIKNSYQFKIPKDFTVFTYTESLKNYFDYPVKATKISLHDFEKLESTIQKQISLNITKFRKHKSQSDYFKQCIFVINANNEKEVWLQGISKKSSFKESWKNQIIDVNDGGEYYFILQMNLTTGKIYYFSPHGLA